MRVIVPTEIGLANLISSTIAEPDLGAAWAAYSTGTTYSEGMRCTSGGKVFQSRRDLNVNNALPVAPEMLTVWWDTVTEAAYSGATTYTLAAQVVDTVTHRRYESLQAGNTGHALPIYPETQNDWWLDIGVTNRWACLDASRNTQSITASTLTLVIQPSGYVNSLAIMGLDANTATISLSIANPAYPKTLTLLGKPAKNWYEYYYGPFSYSRSLVMFDIPPYNGLQITITLTKTDASPVRLGSIFVGNWVYLGATQYDAVSDVLNFSVIERDIYGTATLVPRLSVPKTNQKLILDKSGVNAVLAARKSLNARPAVYCGMDDQTEEAYYESLQIVGIYKAFSINLANYSQAEVNLELEEI